MKKKIKRYLSGLCAVIILGAFALSLNTMASTGSGLIRVPAYSVYRVSEQDATRTGNYSYVTVGVDRVYPTGPVTDNYKKCKTVLYHQNVMISSEYTITEGSSKQVPITEGFLSRRYFDLCFAGNSPEYDAFVEYSYNGH